VWRNTCSTHSEITEFTVQYQTESENFCIQHSKMYLVQCHAINNMKLKWLSITSLLVHVLHCTSLECGHHLYKRVSRWFKV